MALCDAGIEKGEITTSKEVKIETDIPKNKGYKKIEISGDGNCGWYSILEYFHLYGDKLILDRVPEDLKDIINSVKDPEAAGRGPVLIVQSLVVSFTLIVPVENNEYDTPQRAMCPYLY